MTERLIGETGSKKRRRFLFVPIVLVACLALFVVAGAQAVSDKARHKPKVRRIVKPSR